MTRFLRKFSILAMAALVLASCGKSTSDSTSPYEGLNFFELLAMLDDRHEEDISQVAPERQAALRQALEADGQPIQLVQFRAYRFFMLMAPFGQNGDVTTWASTAYQSLALRNGMLLSSRGFGRDLMASVGPSTARVASGTGQTIRQYIYLDGADQRVVVNYSCNLATAGSETVVVLGRAYATRKVVESCDGAEGAFQNSFWFDQAGQLRQSLQTLGLGKEQIFLQLVVDQHRR